MGDYLVADIELFVDGKLVDKKLENLKADEWIRVKGKFEVKNINGDRQNVIKPDSIEKIAQPADPYFY